MVISKTHNKRIAKNTLFLYFRSLFILLISLYTSRITLEVLGIEDFGIYQVVSGIVAMLSLLNSTLSSASQRFITFSIGSSSPEEVNKVLSTSISLHYILGIIIVVFLEIIGIWFINNKINIPVDRIETARWVLQFSIATFFIEIISVPYNALIIAHEKMDVFSYISVFGGLLKLGAVLILCFIPWNKLQFYAAFYFFISLFLRVIYVYYSKKNFEEGKNVLFKIDNVLFKKMFAFTGWNLIGNGSAVLRNQGMDILMNLFFGVRVNAAKGICNQVGAAVNSFSENFTTAVNPQLTQAIALEDFNRSNYLIFHGEKLAFSLMMIMVVPIMTDCKELLSIWLVEVPEYTVAMIKLTLIYMLVDILARFLINANLAYGKIRTFQIFQGGIKVLAFPMAYLMLTLGEGPLVCFWCNLVVNVISIVPIIYIVKKQVHLNAKRYLLFVYLPCWICFTLAFALSYLVKLCLNPNIIISLVISFILSVTTLWLFLFDRSEQKYLLLNLRKMGF